MSAMKMDFICKDSPEVPKQSPASPSRVVKANANAKLSNLLNSAEAADDLDDAMNDQEEGNDHEIEEEDEEEEQQEEQSARGRAHGDTNDMGGVQLPPLKKPKLNETTPVTMVTQADVTDAANELSDNENSEDEQAEYAPWEDMDLNPAVDLINKVVRESLEGGKTYNKSITAKTSQLLTGCDSVLLELKNLTDLRDASRKKSSKQSGTSASGAQQDSINDCSCGIAFSMLPLANKSESTAPVSASSSDIASKRTAKVDEFAEDMTDRVLFKIEASMERLREIAELIQATSMQGEANLVSKVTLPTGAMVALNTAIQASAAAATAAAVAQERGRTAAAASFGRRYSPLQVHKMQEWYYAYPRPLTDELTLMRTILNYRPFANPCLIGGLTIAHVRDWFKRRRYRERIRYVKLAVEAGRDAAAAEEEIDFRIEQRIDHLRVTVDPNELVKELDKVRAESSMYDSMISSFARPEMLDAYVSASHALPSFADRIASQNGGGRAKRQRTQESDLDDAIVVKVGNANEMAVLQNRIRSLLAMPRSATNTNALQQVIDILRSMDISKDVRIQTGLVADLKKILKVYKKPTLLRKSTISLLECLGMSQRIILDDHAHDEAPPKVEEPAVLTHTASPATETSSIATSATSNGGDASGHAKSDHAANGSNGTASAAAGTGTGSMASSPVGTPVVKSARGKREKGKIQRPMKFSMKQVMQLEAWFQQKYKPTQAEMEKYLDALNAAPLRDEKQPMDVNMTQLRRWFNKRRCLRRPPFALMTQQEAAKEGSKNAAALEAAGALGMEEGDLSDDGSNDDSSDEDDSSGDDEE